MDRLGQIEAFIRVAEEGSFSAAARSLKTTQPSISKAVADLERGLKTRLLHRTTRMLSLTEAGAAYYDRMKRVVDLLDEANSEAFGAHEGLRGRIRVNAPALLAGSLVVPAALAFQTHHPNVSFDITVEDRRVDPVEEGADVAVRVGALSDSTLRVKRAGRAKLGIYCAPEYLARRGLVIEHVGDFADCQFIGYSDRSRTVPPPPLLKDIEGRVHQPTWSPTLTVSNAFLAREAALGGAGIAILPRFFAADDTRLGRLAEPLPLIQLQAMEISLLHPFTRDPPHRVELFMEFAVEHWRGSGAIER